MSTPDAPMRIYLERIRYSNQTDIPTTTTPPVLTTRSNANGKLEIAGATLPGGLDGATVTKVVTTGAKLEIAGVTVTKVVTTAAVGPTGTGRGDAVA